MKDENIDSSPVKEVKSYAERRVKLNDTNIKKLKKYSNIFFGPLAQLVEHFPFKEGVIGSNPIRLTKNKGFFLK